MPRQRVARLVLAGAFVLLGAWTLHRFLPALAWAVVFAIAVWPLYRRCERRWPARGHGILLPGLFTLVVGLVFLVPLGLAAAQLGREAHALIDWARTAQQDGLPVPPWVPRLPVAGPAVASWWNDTLGGPAGMAALLNRLNRSELLAYGRAFGTQLAHRAVLFGFMLVTLFFLLRDGAGLAGQCRQASLRAFGSSGERIGRQMVASVHGTVNGLVLVGLGEGVLLGIAYALAGVPHPTLLGAATAVAAMIPFGAPLVFGLAALWLLAVQGALAAAVAVLLFGVVVTFVADHVVRPALIGGVTRLPFLWVLLGILGGVETWGLLGLFLGPAIMAVLILLWREWLAGGGAAGEVG
ncbi:AI-2E family transporter [Roseomonas sp. BN140053]|uniref:AI-2E family transporter n=1 Tax=Roseomonas sp. BN140053 TaxID=3391898 RepID=UPI0039EB3B5D